MKLFTESKGRWIYNWVYLYLWKEQNKKDELKIKKLLQVIIVGVNLHDDEVGSNEMIEWSWCKSELIITT